MSNLEPIEEKDLDLKDKFSEKKEMAVPDSKEILEKIPTLENMPERKEGAMEKDESYSKILLKVKSSQPADDQAVPQDAKDLSLEEAEKNKIEKLIQLAMQKGVIHAVKVARHLQDNYVLDEFHDRLLSEEFHDALVQNGLIKGV